MKKQFQKLITQKQAEDIFKKYIALLYRLIVEEKNDFDLIIGTGDSGSFMAKVAKLFYNEIRKNPPKIVFIPLQRFAVFGSGDGEYFNNSVLVPDLKKQLGDLKKLENVLFADDEIWRAWTAKESMNLVLKAVPKNKTANRVLYTIVAEHHGFEWHYDVSPVAIRYYSFSKKIRGVNGSVFEIVSDKTIDFFRKYKNDLNKRRLANVFLNGINKISKDNKPQFSDNLSCELELRMKRFNILKKNFYLKVEKLVKSGIIEYKEGKIKFIF